ncbi:MAG: hypothetical protein LBK29_02095 [Oscillospiraceae bacterium]|jgi:hypothetical protein|nr:hypothetical protein [Oscillospiraceae bacterium]
MNKNKIFRYFCYFFILTIILFGGLILSKWCLNTKTNNFDTQITSEHFKIYYNFSDEKVVPDILKHLEYNYEKITKNLKQEPKIPVEIKIYSDLDSLHMAIKLNSNFFWWTVDTPDWIVGSIHNGGTISIVSPLNSGRSEFTYNEILKVAVHEFTHSVTLNINSKRNGDVLSEGIALHEADQKQLLEFEILPSSIGEMFLWNTSNQPQKTYACGRHFVDFIIENYGYDKFLELYKKDYGENFDEEIKKIFEKWLRTCIQKD